MADQDKSYYYRAVPGSRELLTSSAKDDRALQMIEGGLQNDDGLAPRINYRGEWLGGVRFEAGIAVPAAVFDVLAPLQSPLEQAVYFHLFRLAYGQGRNWCRVGKRELRYRARVSDRRLNAALDGLVRKGHIKPVHRSTRGTLYRVYLPSEILDLAAEQGMALGEKIELEPDKAKAPAPGRGPAGAAAREVPLESPLNEERFADVSGRPLQGPSVVEMAEWFFRAKAKKPKPRDRQLAVTVLTGLLEDGFTRQEVQKALAWFVEALPEEQDLDRLPYFINKALERDGAVS